MIWFTTSADTATIPINPINYQRWDLRKVQQIERYSDSYLIRCDQPCYVISPPLSYFAIDASDHPYVSAVFDPRSSIRDCRVLLWSQHEPGRAFVAMPLVEEGRLLCDLRDRQPWNSVQPFASTPERIGLTFTGTLLLKNIAVSNILSVSDYSLLLANRLTSAEPPAPHWINDLYGGYLFGWSMTTAALGVVVVAVLLGLAAGCTSYPKILTAGLACAVAFLYLPWGSYLYRQIPIAAGHSSFKYDVMDEYRSCYGADFSSLSRALYDRVAPQSTVNFLGQNPGDLQAESNLLEFIHRQRYEPSTFGAADYYFGYKQPGAYDALRGLLTDPASGKTIAVMPIFRQNDSFILKAAK